MKGSWGLYGHRPRPDSRDWVTSCMRGALAPCQSQGEMSAQGGSENKLQLGGKCGKEVGVSVMSESLEGDARTWSHPHWDTLPELFSPCECQGLHQAGHPPKAVGHPLPLLPGRGVCGHLLPTGIHAHRDMSAQGAPYLPPGSQLDEGTDRLVGAGATGEHVGLVEGLEEADEVGTLGLHRGDVCQA